MIVLFWGTYDKGKPRNRILLRGLRENEIDVRECHVSIWQNVEDKSQVRGLGKKLHFLIRLISAYPMLVYRFFRFPRPDVVVVGYLGHLDVLVLWLFAKIRRVPIVWDAFLSLYDTIICDRKLLSKNNPLAKLLYFWEWLACRAAKRIVLDTRAHADYFAKRYNLPGNKFDVAFVGVEPENFPNCLGRNKKISENIEFVVLFYGQFIPLHGIETIIGATKLLNETSIKFDIVGDGQEAKKIANLLKEYPLKNLSWIKWIEYSQLQLKIHQADLCLGIFGQSEKASRVIPNKVFQILHSGKPLITRDSPAIRELLHPDMTGIFLVPAGSPDALAEAILTAQKLILESADSNYLHPQLARELIVPHAIGYAFSKALIAAAKV